MSNQIFPPIPLDNWQATRDTITVYAQLLGKIRRAMTPKQKHWWHVSLRIISVGISTTPIPAGNKTVQLILDFTIHRLIILTSHGERHEIPLQGQSASAFCTEVLDALAELNIKPEIDRTLFADDTAGGYDETAVSTFWQALSQIDVALKTFKHSFREESSPVQLWPHHFDLAVVWFSGRLIPGQDPANEENADEQMNFGFSTGDSSIAEPYFYATAYPTPDPFTQQPLPTDAYWHTEGFTAAILPYQSLVSATDPHAKLLNFLHTAHKAGSQFMK
ncbi:MAG: hypothetical protein DWQ04_00810 [Chloroflexi bacterium]|nr:MAG: hypothetical protein DWQ04_00810 [Chloroflexota bacterium]